MDRSCNRVQPGWLAILCFGLVTCAVSARGAEHTPRIDVSIPIEVQNDWTYDSDDSANRHNQLFPTIEPEATLHVVPGVSLVGHAVIEPVRDAEAGEDRTFEDVGVFMEELYADYAVSRYGVRGGKFGVAFGVGWDMTPGVYGTDFAEAGYELTERIGLAGRAKLETAAAGAYTFVAHGFFRDTTVLSESLGRGRGTTDRSDGGVSNTEDLSSFALTLDGENLAGVKGLGMRLSIVRQARGVDSTEAETGISAALWHQVNIDKELMLSPMIEYVNFDDADGVSGQNRDFLTLASRLDWRRWNLALAYTGRDTDTPGAAETDDFQFQISAGYAFDFGLEFNVGWQIANEGDIESQRIGLLAAYALEF